MFQDLVVKAKVQANDAQTVLERKNEVRDLFVSVIEGVLPEMNELGFRRVEFSTICGNKFTLRLQVNSYSYYDYTYNMELSSTRPMINYGYGANSAKGKQMKFDYNWNNSKLVATMKHALRATISDALKALENNKMREANTSYL